MKRSIQNSQVQMEVLMSEKEEPEILLTPLAVNSFTSSDHVHWRQSTRWNSYKEFKHVKAGRARESLWRNMLGKDVLLEHTNINLAFAPFECVAFTSQLPIGKWSFGTDTREDGYATMRTSQAWFSIRAKHAPQYSDNLKKVSSHSDT